MEVKNNDEEAPETHESYEEDVEALEKPVRVQVNMKEASKATMN